MICVPDSATAPNIETYKEQKLSVSDYPRRIWLSRKIFCAGVIISGQFKNSSSVCQQLDFLKVGFLVNRSKFIYSQLVKYPFYEF